MLTLPYSVITVIVVVEEQLEQVDRGMSITRSWIHVSRQSLAKLSISSPDSLAIRLAAHAPYQVRSLLWADALPRWVVFPGLARTCAVASCLCLITHHAGLWRTSCSLGTADSSTADTVSCRAPSCSLYDPGPHLVPMPGPRQGVLV